MILLKPSFYFLADEIENDYLLKIERCTRLSYKSEDKIDMVYKIDENMSDDERAYAINQKDIIEAESKRIKFLSSVIARGHTSVLEHYRVCFKISESNLDDVIIIQSKHIIHTHDKNAKCIYLSSNLRAFYDMYKNSSSDYLIPLIKKIFIILSDNFSVFFQAMPTMKKIDAMCNISNGKIVSMTEGDECIEIIDPSTIENLEYRSYHDYKSVIFITNRGVTHEAVRHRVASFVQESSRYCNYSKCKFGKELSFIDPQSTFDSIDDNNKKYATLDFMNMNRKDILNIIKDTYQIIETAYLKLVSLGCPPDVARNVLPIGVKTEIVITQTVNWWREFFKLRTTNNVHPDMLYLSKPLLKEMARQTPDLFNDLLIEE